MLLDTFETLFLWVGSEVSDAERAVALRAAQQHASTQPHLPPGSAVTLVERTDRLLPREDADAARLVQEQLAADGVRLLLGHTLARVERRDDARVATLDSGEEVSADEVLVAAGRRPNLDLGLDAAGVRSTARGVEVDDHLRTANAHSLGCHYI